MSRSVYGFERRTDNNIPNRSLRSRANLSLPPTLKRFPVFLNWDNHKHLNIFQKWCFVCKWCIFVGLRDWGLCLASCVCNQSYVRAEHSRIWFSIHDLCAVCRSHGVFHDTKLCENQNYSVDGVGFIVLYQISIQTLSFFYGHISTVRLGSGVEMWRLVTPKRRRVFKHPFRFHFRNLSG